MGAVALGVVLTIAFGILLARLLGFGVHFGLLTGGAVAICGASAALALAAALPAHPQKERAAAFTVIGVSLLSTVAMMLYRWLVHWLGFDAHAAGVFLGGTIHDVAQVVGAGYSVSQEAGDTATVVKLLRVASARAGDPLCGDAGQAACRRADGRRQAPAVAALVRGGILRAGCAAQLRRCTEAAVDRRPRPVSGLPGRVHGGHRAQDTAEGDGHRGLAADRAHGGCDGLLAGRPVRSGHLRRAYLSR